MNPEEISQRLELLRIEHRDLDAKIANEERRPAPDVAMLAQMKKQKLKIKEELFANG